MKLRSLLLTLLTAFAAIPLAAQLENGKIYRFVNKADTNIALSAATARSVYGTQYDAENYSQLWMAETHPNAGAAWSLRNLGNGLYLTPRGTSTVWTFSASPSNSTILYCVNVGDYYTMNKYNNVSNSESMHYATSQGGAVVGWNTSADATLWTIQEVTIDEATLNANWAELDAFTASLTDEKQAEYTVALENLFSDKACTVLKKTFASEAAIEADADYQALSSDLQAMVKKVYSGDWSENNFDSSKPGWSSEYGKRYRVQSIEPYSIAGEITSWLGINAHANMDNPTGIFGNYRQHVYLLVEGEIKDGAELYAGTIKGHGLLDTYENGIELHEGLNVLPFYGDKNAIYINYVVHTYDPTTNTFPHKLSEYDNLKIHIVGGNINGFYNGMGDHLWGEPDDDTDWQYIEDRACLESATIVGQYQILHFRMEESITYELTNDEGVVTGYATDKGMSYYLPNNILVPAGTPSNKKVATMLEAWDRVHMSEWATMGLLSKAQMDSVNALYPRYDQNWQKAGNIYDYNDYMYELQNGRDYSEYINHHGIALGTFSGYMSGGWRNCNYHHNTMGSIIGEIATNSGSAWGPGHEIGHQHQTAMNLRGLTEVTNNLFSNVAVWYMGLGTSRINGSEGSLERLNKSYQENVNFLFHHHDNGSQNLWTQTHLYYKLWLYYHLLGNNTAFFPRLYELCRQTPLQNAYNCNGTQTLMRFYKHVCDAAGEDLTEFFRAHGFFVTMDNMERGDYSTGIYTQTQAEVDAAIASVKAKGYKENIVPLFVNDCVATPSYGHDGKTKRSYWDPETESGLNAKVGMYTTCIDTTQQATGYLYNVTNGNVSILYDNTSTGAIGFIIYNGDDLVAFTSNYNVEIPVGLSDVKIYAVQPNGEKVELLSAAEAGDPVQQRTALRAALTSASTLLTKVATSKNDIGYFYDYAVEYLSSLYDSALASYNNEDMSEHTYGQWATLLNTEISRLVKDKHAIVAIKETNVYTLANNNSKSYYLAYYNNALKAANSSQVASNSDYRRWEFVSAGEENTYYMKNVGSGLYITEIAYNENATITSTIAASAAKFVANYNGDGTVSFSLKDDNNASLYCNSDYSITGNKMSENRAKWVVKLVKDNATPAEQAQLEELIGTAERTIEEVGYFDENDSLIVNNDVLPLTGKLGELMSDLDEAYLSASENKDTAIDLLLHIDNLNEALTALDGTYILTPTSSHEGPITWYYIKNIDENKYCTVDTVKTTKAYKTAVNLGDLDADNRHYWWAFIATGNENEYEVYNAATKAYLYTTNLGGGTMKADGAEDASAYLITPDTETIGLIINEGSKYWTANQGYTKVRAGNNRWKIEKICTEDGNLTGIEEIIGDEQVVEGIYDLTGRRIEEITVPGIYIVNGKKMLIK